MISAVGNGEESFTTGLLLFEVDELSVVEESWGEWCWFFYCAARTCCPSVAARGLLLGFLPQVELGLFELRRAKKVRSELSGLV